MSEATDKQLTFAKTLLAKIPDESIRKEILDEFDVDEELIDALTSPTIILGNPFTGAYSDAVFEDCSIIVKRSDLKTDKSAFGYGADEVFGGYSLKDSTATITVAS